MANQIYNDRWEIVSSLGEGGQAHTFLAKDLKGEGQTLYVLKRLKNNNRIERFKREIEAVRNLTHENIVSLIDFDLQERNPYLVMEYCNGGNLAKSDAFWRVSPIKALNIFEQICRGVAYAHNQGIIHRDIKPENIFLRTKDGPAVVGDFGICYFVEGGERFTLTEEAVGPRLFIAPELEDGRLQDISTKSDVYSLGKLLYWLLSGRIFSREKYRERDWDLKGYNVDNVLGWHNIYMEHINRLLDLMIVPEPGKRRDVDNILLLLKQTKRLVAKEYTPIAEDIKQPCTYCGQGFYVLEAKENLDVRNFGFATVGAPNWRIFVCNRCGHVQAFRLDKVNDIEWWWE